MTKSGKSEKREALPTTDIQTGFWQTDFGTDRYLGRHGSEFLRMNSAQGKEP
jgi:hypothetical protein